MGGIIRDDTGFSYCRMRINVMYGDRWLRSYINKKRSNIRKQMEFDRRLQTWAKDGNGNFL